MLILVVTIFIVGYLMIAFEHPIKINKAASALLTGTILWILYVMNGPEFESLVSVMDLRLLFKIHKWLLCR